MDPQLVAYIVSWFITRWIAFFVIHLHDSEFRREFYGSPMVIVLILPVGGEILMGCWLVYAFFHGAAKLASKIRTRFLE